MWCSDSPALVIFSAVGLFFVVFSPVAVALVFA
jgi:hypothetical protein